MTVTLYWLRASVMIRPIWQCYVSVSLTWNNPPGRGKSNHFDGCFLDSFWAAQIPPLFSYTQPIGRHPVKIPNNDWRSKFYVNDVTYRRISQSAPRGIQLTLVQKITYFQLYNWRHRLSEKFFSSFFKIYFKIFFSLPFMLFTLNNTVLTMINKAWCSLQDLWSKFQVSAGWFQCCIKITGSAGFKFLVK